MPNKTITAPGSTVAVNILKNGTNYADVRNATAGTNAGNADTKFTLNAKSGSNYFIRRGMLLYDFSTVDIPRGVKVLRAHLVLNDVSESAAQGTGDMIRVSWIDSPNTFGGIHANDYNRNRTSTDTATSAQSVNNGADGEIIQLDRPNLLIQLAHALNNRTWLHLCIRNQLDWSGTTPTGMNKVWFDRPNADDNPLQLVVYYAIDDLKTNIGSGANGRASNSGFGGANIFAGTSSGFA